jgi:hypothetical protein
MIEIFNYTERVVNMVRPRKVLFMAIGSYQSEQDSGRTDGIPPRWCRTPRKDESATVSSVSCSTGSL